MPETRRGHGLPGLFVTFEGGEGSGKSTLSRSLAARMREAGFDVVATREPGGSPLAERARNLLLAGAFGACGPEAEAVIFALARSDHLRRTVIPALARGAVVLCDRFFDSTRAYQGASGGTGKALLDALEEEAVDVFRPDLTFVVDCPVEVGLGRARRRSGADADRFEAESTAFHEAVRATFLEVAASDPGRCAVLDGCAAPEDVLAAAVRLLPSRWRP